MLLNTWCQQYLISAVQYLTGHLYRHNCTTPGIGSTVLHLVSAVVRDVVRELVQQQVQRVGLGEGHPFDVLKVLGGAALISSRMNSLIFKWKLVLGGKLGRMPFTEAPPSAPPSLPVPPQLMKQ